jgi:hypothetical protein
MLKSLIYVEEIRQPLEAGGWEFEGGQIYRIGYMTERRYWVQLDW